MTFIFVSEMCAATPGNIFMPGVTVHSPFESIATFATNYFTGKSITILILSTSLDDSFFYGTLMNKSLSRLEIFTVDNSCVMIFHQILCRFAMVVMANEVLI